MVFILGGSVMGVFICFAVLAVCYRKTTVSKYEKDYKKPIPKNYITAGNHSQEDSLDGAGATKMKTLGPGASMSSFGRADSQRVLFRPSNHMPAAGPSYQDHKLQQLKRMGVGGEDLEEIGGSSADVERTLKTLNGYHDDIVEALRKAAAQRGISTPSGSTSALSEELLRRSLQQCAESYSDFKGRSSGRGSKENVCEQGLHEVVIEHEEEDEDEVPPCGTLRIRNLEDLIRQLEHHSRHMSPSGSEDIRMSETEADRHYRQESSSACSESSHQSHRDSRFVYGRYRQPSARLLYPQSHRDRQAEEEGIYESADHDRGGGGCQDTPDSESSTAASPLGQ
ncbi:uncharacterized protein LOC143191072 isoform X2 [Rhynchophorus ferrugineus]|uniref:uncharacterized protein LOC143191072 isoform X2 n=1 Tax=Rhynchophorus ferrugineus TaxID=354439 RepID=UPI003FCECB2A